MAREPDRTCGELVAVDPSITAIERDFLFDGRPFSQLEIAKMAVDELDLRVNQIAAFQLQEQDRFFGSTSLDRLQMISEEDYLARQLWLFEELMVLPVRRESKLSGEYVVLNASDCPSLHGLREMLRAIRRAEAYSRREQERYRTFVSDMLARFPLATSVESPDRTVVYFYDADGSVCASRRLSTVGNF